MKGCCALTHALSRSLVFFSGLGVVLMLPLHSYQLFGFALVGLILFAAFYVQAQGRISGLDIVFVIVGVTLVPAFGQENMDVGVEFAKGFSQSALALFPVIWIAFAVLPAGVFPRLPSSPRLPGTAAERGIVALRPVVILLPLLVYMLGSANNIRYLIGYYQPAMIAQHASRATSRKLAGDLMMTTLIGASSGLLMWWLMKLWPSWFWFVLLMALFTAFFATRIFADGPAPLTPNYYRWSYGLSTLVFIVFPDALTQGFTGDDPNMKFYQRRLGLGQTIDQLVVADLLSFFGIPIPFSKTCRGGDQRLRQFRTGARTSGLHWWRAVSGLNLPWEQSMSADPFAELKQRQRAMWASFGPTAMFTTPVAGQFVKFAQLKPGETVLDVGTGTGVVAITAARAGAKVTALDLTPELLEQARENAGIAGLGDITWNEGDAEGLPYLDNSFDVVLSQFGHMFAPRPDVTIAEMRRVLKPTGRVAFATWPPEHFVGRLFAFVGRHSPPPPQGAAPPPLWGHPTVVTERLGPHFEAPFFERGTMVFPALSLQHFRSFMERSIGPMQKLVESLAGDPSRLAAIRAEFEALAAPYYIDNVVHQSYLMTRARAK